MLLLEQIWVSSIETVYILPFPDSNSYLLFNVYIVQFDNVVVKKNEWMILQAGKWSAFFLLNEVQLQYINWVLNNCWYENISVVFEDFRGQLGPKYFSRTKPRTRFVNITLDQGQTLEMKHNHDVISEKLSGGKLLQILDGKFVQSLALNYHKKVFRQ